MCLRELANFLGSWPALTVWQYAQPYVVRCILNGDAFECHYLEAFRLWLLVRVQHTNDDSVSLAWNEEQLLFPSRFTGGKESLSHVGFYHRVQRLDQRMLTWRFEKKAQKFCSLCAKVAVVVLQCGLAMCRDCWRRPACLCWFEHHTVQQPQPLTSVTGFSGVVGCSLVSGDGRCNCTCKTMDCCPFVFQ